MKKRLLLGGLIVAGLLLIGLQFVPRSSILPVSAKQWTGLNGPMGVDIGDYNNDGSNDIAMAEWGSSIGTGKVTVYKSDGTTIVKQWTGLNFPEGVAIGDYNGDGSNDIVIAESGDTWGSGKVTVYKSDGTTVIKQWTGLSFPEYVALGDYDNDGFNELAFTDSNPRKVTVYKNDGATVVKQFANLMWPRGVAIGDYDNDGFSEIAVTDQDGNSVTVYRRDGATVAKQFSVLSPFGGAIGDYDNDGFNEIAFTYQSVALGPLNVVVYRSDGVTKVKEFTGFGGSVQFAQAIGDYNNDGLNDFAFSEYHNNRVTVYYQTRPGTLAKVAEPTIVTLRGTLTDTGGYPIQNGSVRVTIRDSMGTQLWQDTFNDVIDNGRYNIQLGAKTPLRLVKGQIYNAMLEVDVGSATFVSADVIYGDNNPTGDIIKFVAN